MVRAGGLMARSKARRTVAAGRKRRVASRAGKPRQRDATAEAVEAALAALAHEIRTPLTGILALSELLAAAPLGERERRWAASIKGAAEHLAQLTTVVCDAARARAKGLVLSEETFSPRRLADDVAASLTARAQASGLEADVAIAPDLPAAVIGDVVRLRAALENLIDNAVKFTARGVVRFEAAAKRGRGRQVELDFSVTDSGIGLSAAEIRRLYRPFAQANAEISRRYGGAGLGLMLVKRLAGAMHGDLGVTSAPGRGSCFRLRVRLKEANASPSDASVDPAPAAGSRATDAARPLRILCVEDSPYSRTVMNAILSELGHAVEFAESGEAAIDAVGAKPFDVVLMDVTLKGLDGFAATRRIRALPTTAGRVPVIGISGRSDTADAEAARRAGMNAYLAKPISPAALVKVIATVTREPR
jgi:CheY-like chemotaxis protein